MDSKLYPLRFDPILKHRIWGGQKLQKLLRKPYASDGLIGESWELSGVDGDISVVAEGKFRGRTLNSLLDDRGPEILGENVFKQFGASFPLLFKFIDAKQDLSIQVHPNDELAQRKHNSFGKTEMWYVVQADPGSRIIVGFCEKSNPEQYLASLRNNTLPDLLKSYPGKEGDVFFLDTGTIHAIGAGVLIAEIQQTSDITYRIYDWDRVEESGEPRELHVDEALEAMNYDVVDPVKSYDKSPNVSNAMVACPYFTTNIIPLDGVSGLMKRNSFTVLMCVSGDCTLRHDLNGYRLAIGDTILIPAVLDDVVLEGRCKLLEIYIS